MNNISIPNKVLALLMDMAREHIQEIENGFFEPGIDSGLDDKKACLATAEKALNTEHGSVDVACWNSYEENAKPKMTHAMEVTDNRTSSGQMYVDVATKGGAVDDLLALAIEVQSNPLIPADASKDTVPCVLVNFDGDNLAFTAFKIGNDILLRPENGVSVSSFRHGLETFYWVK